MRDAPLVKLALAAAVVLGLVALLRPGEPAPRASVPDEFGQLTEALRSYDTLYVAFDHSAPGDDRIWRYVMYASGDGRVVIDFYRWENDLHWFWNGNRLLEDERDAAEIPPRAADVEPIFAELLSELSSGFATSTIEIVKAPEGGSTVPDLIWGKLTLPFGWASGVAVYVEVWERTMKPTGILLDSPGIRELWGEPLRVRIADLSVNVPVPKGTFSMQAAKPLCLPSVWSGRHVGRSNCVPPHDPGNDPDGVDWKRPDAYPASAFAKGGKCRVEASDRAADAASPRCP